MCIRDRKLSDITNIPLKYFIVTSIELGVNFQMNKDVSRYLNTIHSYKSVSYTHLHLPSVDEEVDWDFYKCVLPIPEDQFIFSPEMEQNPGYPKN